MNARRMLCLGWMLGLAGCGASAESDGGMTGRDAETPATDGGGGRDGGGTTQVDGGTTPTDGGTTPNGFTCTSGVLLAGHPEFDSDVGNRATEGDPLAGVMNRPILYRELAFVGDQLVTVTGAEVWSSDLSASAPVVHRIAGNDADDQALIDGPCAGARFGNLQDLAVDSEGAIYVMDQTANAVLKITDPFGASCTVHYWAGTSTDIADLSPNDPPNIGETDGPGLAAQFALPGRMAIDANDNLYVWDEGNASIRKIANDASHTVSTLAPVESFYDGRSQDVIVDALAVLGPDLYLYGHDTAGQVILEAIALSDGARREIFRGGGDLFPDFTGGSRQPGGMTTDGVDLFLYFKGIVYRVTTAGVMTRIAGDPTAMYNSEFDSDYDPAVPHPALETQLPTRDQFSTAGAGSWLSIDDHDNLYFIGSVLDPYIVRLTCGR